HRICRCRLHLRFRSTRNDGQARREHGDYNLNFDFCESVHSLSLSTSAMPTRFKCSYEVSWKSSRPGLDSDDVEGLGFLAGWLCHARPKNSASTESTIS